MRAWQHAGLDGDRAHGAHVAPVDAAFAGQHLAAHQVVLEPAELIAHLLCVELRRLARGQGRDDRRLYFGDARVASLLLGEGVRLRELRLGLGCNGRGELSVARGLAPLPRRLAGLGGQLPDRADSDLHLLVTVHHGAQHYGFGQPLRLGLDHQDRVRGAGDHEVERRALQILRGRVEQVLAVVVADARAADRPLEGHAGETQRCRCAQHRRHVGVDLGVERDHRRDDLHFVIEAFGEEWPDRAIDQPRGERFLLRGTAFALEEAARDAACRVGLLHVVDGKRQEVLAGRGFLAAHGRDEDDGVAHGNECGAVGLACETPRLEGDAVRAVLKGFLVDVHDRWSGAG